MKKIFFNILFFLVIFMFLPFFTYANNDNVQNQKFPTINARHAIIYDRSSGNMIYGKDETEICKMASTTKIMTALVVLENSNLKDTVKISSKAAGIGGSRLGLSTNDKLTVENLLYGLMLKSGNDAAIALAEYVGRKYRSICRQNESKSQNS